MTKMRRASHRSGFRRFVLTGAALVLIVGAAACGDDSADTTADQGAADEEAAEGVDGTLTFVSWGGTYQDYQSELWLEPFATETGVEILQDGPTDYANVRTQVETDNVMWDVVVVEPHFAEAACEEGLLEPLDYDVIDTSGMVEPDLVSECGVPIMLNAYPIAYNTEAFDEGQHPQNWEDFFDTEEFPGQRAFWNFPQSGALEAALLADGVPGDELYPLDLDRAFAKLDTIRDDIIWFESGAEQQELLRSGEASALLSWVGRIHDLANEGEPVDVEWGQHLAGIYDVVAVPAGSENRDAAMELIDHIIKAEPQAALAEAMAYAPIHTDAAPELTDLQEHYLPTTPENWEQRGMMFDWQWWAENEDEVAQQFAEWQQQ